MFQPKFVNDNKVFHLPSYFIIKLTLFRSSFKADKGEKRSEKGSSNKTQVSKALNFHLTKRTFNECKII